MRVVRVTKAVFLLALAALLVLPAVASAVLSGANGRIAYVSGRGYGDAKAQLYLRVAAGSTGFGLNSGPFGLNTTRQSRHPSWSPDRTKIAFARGEGEGFCPPTDCDIFVIDLTAPVPFPQKLTNTPMINEDRPAWSPDGTRIAYESEVTNGSNQTDILVDPVGEGATLNLTNTGGAGQSEGKPAWTPDSSEIYYHKGDPTKENSLDVVKEPATGGAVTNIVASPAVNEFQPSLSPDGKQLCFTRGTGVGFNATADVMVSLANGGGQLDLSDDAVGGNYNCTWSPTGLLVAYVTGTFSTGDLYLEDADDTSFPLPVEAVPSVFDGNPDWAPDGRPECEDVAATTKVNQPVTIELQCFDTGPFYERTLVREFAGEPENGETSEVVQGDQEPSTVVYTPNDGFTGTDTFGLIYFDEIAGFGPQATVTINVEPPPAPVVDPAPVVRNLTVTPRRWRLGRKVARLSALRVGSKVRWRLSEAASTRLTFQRALRGRRVGKRCVKQTRSNRSKRRCTRFRNAASRKFNGKTGLNTLDFQGRVTARRRLSPGRYRTAAQATDSAGQSSKTVFSKPFTVVRR
ncbi:MAG TPA: hypothetical protein VFZ41_11055 [Solirubrobacterales bacterium]